MIMVQPVYKITCKYIRKECSTTKGLEFAKYSVNQFTQKNALLLLNHLSTKIFMKSATLWDSSKSPYSAYWIHYGTTTRIDKWINTQQYPKTPFFFNLMNHNKGSELSNILIREIFLIYIYREFYAIFIMIYLVANLTLGPVYDQLNGFILFFILYIC